MSAPTPPRRSLAEYLALDYPRNVVADPDGGYIVFFPDLPGCVVEVAEPGEVDAAAERARVAWLREAHAAGRRIPNPGNPEEFSGRFDRRLLGPLQRSLAQAAALEGVSFKEYVVRLLTRDEESGVGGGGRGG